MKEQELVILYEQTRLALDEAADAAEAATQAWAGERNDGTCAQCGDGFCGGCEGGDAEEAPKLALREAGLIH